MGAPDAGGGAGSAGAGVGAGGIGAGPGFAAAACFSKSAASAPLNFFSGECASFAAQDALICGGCYLERREGKHVEQGFSGTYDQASQGSVVATQGSSSRSIACYVKRWRTYGETIVCR